MKILYFLILLNFAVAWDGICPPGAVKSTTSNVCYTFASTTATFIQAQLYCNQQSGNLANVDSQFVNMLLIGSATNLGWSDFWIGASLTKVYNDAGVVKIWIWDGLDKILKYDDWGFNEPSNKGGCAGVKTSDGTWFAEDCGVRKNFVCSTPVKVNICDDEWIYFPSTDFCYRVFYHSDWTTAENNCVERGAHLVSIHSKEENDFLQGKLTLLSP
uniref:C-type lectin domain-containing protein n=1 Tax=Panagrolaimus sp. JU765 TaxID=591449 RepID=A0AC34PV29_9BILA